MSFNLLIPTPRDPVPVPLGSGDILFVLGANGTGKSSLVQRLYAEHVDVARRLTAHRQSWLQSGRLTLTSQNKRNLEQNIRQEDVRPQSRWANAYASDRSAVAIFNLVEKQNAQNREIVARVRDGDDNGAAQLAQQYDDPLVTLSRILHHSNLPITVSLREDEELVATKENLPPYSIAELSDGERNVLILVAEVLTAPPNTLILIDEPERHLHRSIVSPLFRELLSERPDCAYVLSTHDPALALDVASAKVLLVRNCHYEGQAVAHWDVDLVDMSSRDTIDDDLLHSIVGARRDVLFVEGDRTSLDNALYSVILPNVSVIPRGSCKEVEHAVRIIRDAGDLHWLNAFGLIDRDGRGDADIARLQSENIFAIDGNSVESLYYDPWLQKRLADKTHGTEGSQTRLEQAQDEVVRAFRASVDNLVSRSAERRLRSRVMSEMPNRKTASLDKPIEIKIDGAAVVGEERQRLNDAIAHADLQTLIQRYPARETPALDAIARALGFEKRKAYESAVLQLLKEDADALKHVHQRLGGLPEALGIRIAKDSVSDGPDSANGSLV